MAGDWLKVESATPDKPEVLQMACELGIDPDAVFGKLFRVWSWFDAHSEDGNAPSVTEMLLDRQVGVSGFIKSMVSVGWMIKTGSGLTIPNFDSHNGQSAKKRANTARRVAKHKAANGKGNAEEGQEVTQKALPDALAREEKRREEKNTTSELSDGKKASPCPHLEIIEIYHRVLPELPTVIESRWQGSVRAKHLQARWRESVEHQSLEFWERFFCKLRDYSWYFGDNERTWKADLGWIVERRNFDKLLQKFLNEGT